MTSVHTSREDFHVYLLFLIRKFGSRHSVCFWLLSCVKHQLAVQLFRNLKKKMSEGYEEIWKFWYEAQLHEIRGHRAKFSEEKPTVHPAAGFNPEEDADTLRKAMKGIGTTEEDIVDILTKRSLEQRMEIQDKYQQRHGRSLTKDLKSELTGVFEKVILSLLKPLPLFYAEQIKEATKGAGTDETALIEIFCTRDDDFINTVKETFENRFDTSIEKVICKETSGDFEKLLVGILALCRDDAKSSPEAVAEELCAEDLDEDGIRIICTSYSLNFLHRVFNEYKEKSGEDFLELVEKKCSGNTKAAFKAIYQSSKSKAEFFAHAINAAIEGFGTDDSTLVRIIISRCEIDLETVKTKYQKIFEKDLVESVKAEISGDYSRTLLNLLGCFD